ncbi:MAG TPA: hypothetical protein VF401_02485 [Candidatus Saccharimonadales bacterium]
MSSDTDHYDGVLQEDIRHRLDLVMEALSELKNVPRDIRELKDLMRQTIDRQDLLELIVTDHSKVLNEHEIRLTKLETA